MLEEGRVRLATGLPGTPNQGVKKRAFPLIKSRKTYDIRPLKNVTYIKDS